MFANMLPTDVSRGIYHSAIEMRNEYMYNAKIAEVSNTLCDIFHGLFVDKIDAEFTFKELGKDVLVDVEHIFSFGKNTKFVDVSFSGTMFVIKCTTDGTKWVLENFEDDDVDFEDFTLYEAIIYEFIRTFNGSKAS